MNKKTFLKGQLYINYLGPFSALLGNLIATPILISNLGLEEWSLFALIHLITTCIIDSFWKQFFCREIND